jgi:hypothetical protein
VTLLLRLCICIRDDGQLGYRHVAASAKADQQQAFCTFGGFWRRLARNSVGVGEVGNVGAMWADDAGRNPPAVACALQTGVREFCFRVTLKFIPRMHHS